MIKLAHNTIENRDYELMIKFLKKRSYLNQSKITKKFEETFQKNWYKIFNFCKLWVISKFINCSNIT